MRGKGTVLDPSGGDSSRDSSLGALPGDKQARDPRLRYGATQTGDGRLSGLDVEITVFLWMFQTLVSY